MTAKINESELVGKNIAMLTIERSWRNSKREIIVHCLCECGRYYQGRYNSLQQGHTKSCGCLAKQIKCSDAWRRFFIKPPVKEVTHV